MTLYIYFLGFVVTWLLCKLIEVKVIKPSDREEKWTVFKIKLLFSVFSWIGVLAVIGFSIIIIIHELSEDKDPPKWL
jgi:hypothetical protein